jgi:hypothetical protein
VNGISLPMSTRTAATWSNLARQLGTEGEEIERRLKADIDQGTDALVHYVAAADGLQLSADESVATHHYANVLFNIMRGGIFIDGYQSDKQDFLDFVQTRNRTLLSTQAAWFEQLPGTIDVRLLHARAAESGVADLARLCYEYLPLMFSRRHGDPSRPWNRFSINLRQS